MNNNGIDPNTNVNSNPNNVANTSVPLVNNTTNVVSNSSTNTVSNDPGAIVNEPVKKVEINYTPPSKFKVFVLVLFFILLIAFVFFLPEITSFVDKYRSGELNQSSEKVVNGKMKCSLSSQTDNLDKNYFVTFSFSNNKLEKVQFSIATRGDINDDEEELDNLVNTCNKLSTTAKNISGITVKCNYSNGELVEEQSYDLKNINSEDLNAAYFEAGGNDPGYEFGQDMDDIESKMKASNYNCERSKQ